MAGKALSVFISFFIIISFSPAFAAKRVALVIGNSEYKNAPLSNPVNDANDMTRALKTMGFSVITKKNADQRTMEEGLRAFKKILSGAEIGLFYYAGHGMQIEGINYLIPVKNKIREESDVKYFAVNANFVLSKMEDAGAPLNIVILDACRNNPLKRSFRNASQGLAYMEAPDGTLIAYATKSGSVSEDGRGRNGTYTEALLRHIATPGLDVRDMFNKVGLEVKSATGKRQIPWTSSDPIPEYFLAGGTAVVDRPVLSGQGTGLQIDSEPSGADIFIQGSFKGRAPLTLKGLEPGRYSVKARLAGYSEEDKTVVVNAGRKAVVSFYLDVKASKARLYVSTDPSDCKVRILNIGPAFYSGMELEQGQYKLEVSKNGYETKVQTVDIDSPQGIDLYVELTKKQASSVGGTSTWTEPVTGMEFVWVPQGCYQMGSRSGASDEKPVHEVCVDGFWMAKYEVTQGQWKKIMGNNPSEFKSGDNYPVENVSWDDAKNFISKLNSKSGKTFKLPTEAQWEYAARSGGKDEEYAGGNDVDRVAWHGGKMFRNGNSGGRTHSVGTKVPNGLGLYDMSGNVWEWCEDVYDSKAYSKHSRNNPLITSKGSDRVIRGGSWSGFPRLVRSASRYGYDPSIRYSYFGLRLVSLPGQQ